MRCSAPLQVEYHELRYSTAPSFPDDATHTLRDEPLGAGTASAPHLQLGTEYFFQARGCSQPPRHPRAHGRRREKARALHHLVRMERGRRP